jgi:hypothetical protein
MSNGQTLEQQALGLQTYADQVTAGGVFWEATSTNAGTTGFRTTLSRISVLVTFDGDQRRPWSGWWEAVAVDLPITLASDQHVFETSHPDDAAIGGVLEQVAVRIQGA